MAAVCTAAVAMAWSSVTGAQAAIETLQTPAGAGSNAYGMAAGHDGKAYLVWIEPSSEGAQALKFSRFDGRVWNAPRDIARGSNWFVNWADHPSIAAMPDGSLLAHWLVNTGRKEGAYGYGIRVARSTDDGSTWSTIFEDGMKNIADYAGFLTFSPTPQGADAIDPTPLAPDDGTSHGHDDAEHIKTLAAVSFAQDGSVKGQKVVDADVCSCCMTDIAQTSLGSDRGVPRSSAGRHPRHLDRPSRKRGAPPRPLPCSPTAGTLRVVPPTVRPWRLVAKRWRSRGSPPRRTRRG